MQSSSVANTTGIIFIILGLLSIAYPFYSSLGIEVFFGALFLFGGIFHLFGAFEDRQRSGYLWNFGIGAFYILAGVYLFSNPLIGLLSLTMVLIALFFVQGIMMLIFGFQQRSHRQQWVWSIFSGLLTIGLAVILWVGYPISALWALGILVGINLLVFGTSLLLVNQIIGKSTPKKK